MDSKQVKRVVIAGGGTAGWMAAAALSKKLGEVLEITLVESDAIDPVGVGEATIPPMRTFHKLLDIDEQEFMRNTNATFKLGIEFEGWGAVNESYIHSFGKTGAGGWLADFHHFWLRAKKAGIGHEFGDYCLELQAAKNNKFATSPNSNINYAFHLDSSKYGKFLRQHSEKSGARRIEGKILEVNTCASSGHIESLVLDNGAIVKGDLFIDCTGFRALLIEQALHTGYEDWSHWLLCDSAIAAQTKPVGEASPYTRSIARESGWQWKIPLQNRVGNGLVYCSKYMSDDEAISQLLGNVEGEVITDPRVIKFRTGRRLKGWNKNCIALGLSSGFIEPLESTSIHLFMTGITRLMQAFPFSGINQAIIDEYNRRLKSELEQIRDFIVLHYCVTKREDSAFWRHCKSMGIPETLSQRIELFESSGYSYQAEDELFRIDSWVQVMLGQGLIPREYHPLVTTMSDKELAQFLQGIKSQVDSVVQRMPNHQKFVNDYCG